LKLLKRILLVQDWIRKTSNNIEEGAMLHCAFLHLQPLPRVSALQSCVLGLELKILEKITRITKPNCSPTPSCSPSHAPQCHIYPFLEHLPRTKRQAQMYSHGMLLTKPSRKPAGPVVVITGLAGGGEAVAWPFLCALAMAECK